ncbi:receptor-type tyrosine-protein kinase FLT3 [Chanos chanos]|uniref:receptor protein-tyrosine kinase n=1 Tax=Chanos chanos TaxID=29144 RepID=A0A6J2URC2_CHACN|nr:receptor-type tyrosine-protein kinase FLT3 [Chanos chanos]
MAMLLVLWSACCSSFAQRQDQKDGVTSHPSRITTKNLPSRLSERDSDSGTAKALIHVTPAKPALRKPSKPQLKVQSTLRSNYDINCTSSGNPAPQISWFRDRSLIQQSNEEKNGDWASSVIEGYGYHHVDLTCCARNSKGEECTQLYDYDLGSNSTNKEASLVMLRPGDTLLLRCRWDGMDWKVIQWYFKNVTVKSVRVRTVQTFAQYLLIDSVSEENSGVYECKSEDKVKSVTVEVLDHDFINVLEINADNNIAAEEKAEFCFQVQVFSHPRVRCHWTSPAGTVLESSQSNERWGNSTFKLCNPDPGEYRVNLRTENISRSEKLSLCVTDFPVVRVSQDEDHVNCMINSSVPLDVTWTIEPDPTGSSTSVPPKVISQVPEKHEDLKEYCHRWMRASIPRSEAAGKLVKCCANNKAGQRCSEFILVKKDTRALMVACCVLMMGVILLTALLFYFVKKKKPVYQSQLQIIQMMGPSDNDYIYIDFKDFKYEQKWEFPRENLELGKELGSGAFGKVVQATAYGISKPGVSTQVAVKMLKDKHQSVEKEALMSELKMLTFIGQHSNIVNLLGACTGTGPIYLIFQYCCYGDLLNYLKNNREKFHKSLEDAFNKDRFSSLYQNFQQKRRSRFHSEMQQSPDNHYLPMAPVHKSMEMEALLSPLITTSMDTTEDVVVESDLQEEEDLQTLTYDDLLSFSYQVAKGMEFLSSKNCIHRDLAARNVLVTRGRMVKIGDFGLARDIDNDSNYVVRGNVRLPVKWMAPESIFKGIYTMQSDVWAYGILLYEIFSLGVTPYPGMSVDSHFYTMIKRGFQMEQPYYASEPVYKVMQCCWALEPKDRPSFSKLVAFMEGELVYVEEKLYLNAEEIRYSDSIYQNASSMSESTEPDIKRDLPEPAETDAPCKDEEPKKITDSPEPEDTLKIDDL